MRTASASGSNGSVWIAQLFVGLALLGLWEALGRSLGSTWTSLPSEVAFRLAHWAETTLLRNLSITLIEIVAGLGIGASAGISFGILLGRTRVMSVVLRPLIVVLYSVPVVALAPLLILWFGLDLAPKIVLVAISSFFLLFFNTFTGVQGVDRDLIYSMRLMGASPAEELRNITAPAALPWIVSGLKIALPYSIAAAVTGELLAARQGIGSLLTAAAAQFDMTGLYAALLVLMMVGVAASAGMNALERWLLRWRDDKR